MSNHYGSFKPYPAYVPFLTIITLVYLVFELGFNARLLDVTGTLANASDVTAIEHSGRFLSGAAVALFAWGFIFKYFWARRPQLTTFLLAMSAGAIIFSVYHGESDLVSGIVDQSSGQQRKDALILQTARTLVMQTGLKVDNVDLSEHVRSTPYGKAFLSILPAEALRVKNVDQKVFTALENAIRIQVAKQAGDPAHDYNTVYLPANRKLIELYNKSYVPLVNGYHAKLNQYGPNGFAGRENRRFYENNSRRIADEVLPDDLSLVQFAHAQGISAKFAHALGPDVTVFEPNLSYTDYHDRYWSTMVDSQTTKQVKALDHPASDFDDGGPQEKAGRDAMEACVAPPLALLFSILGSLLHSFKVCLYGSIWKWPRAGKAKRWALLSLGAAVVAFAPFVLPNPITKSPLFVYLQNQTEAQDDGTLGWRDAMMYRWIIQSEPYTYPVNELLRRTVLLGMKYGTGDAPNPKQTAS